MKRCDLCGGLTGDSRLCPECIGEIERYYWQEQMRAEIISPGEAEMVLNRFLNGTVSLVDYESALYAILS